MTINESYPATNEADIEALEKQLRVVFPPLYRSFLKRNNGGQPANDMFEVASWAGEESCVDRFFGIRENDPNGLEQVIARFQGRIPSNILPIGTDPGGNLICVGYIVPHIDQIFFWDHEEELDDNGESILDFSIVHYLAVSIDEFLRSLKAS